METKKIKSKNTSVKPTNGVEKASNHANAERLAVQKTYKLYIGGKFPRSESGRYYKLIDTDKKLVANICRASKKDFRDAVVVARKAQNSWADKSAYNKGQILYRIAETMEGRKAQFCDSLIKMGISKKIAVAEVDASIDRLVYYAGWCDKYQQIFSSVNPVESAHFNFSFPEPTGVVSAIAPDNNGLIGLVSILCSAIAGGNSVIILADEKYPLTAIELAEVLNTSDLPGGVVNLLTGHSNELIGPFSEHMDVNAVIYCGNNMDSLKTIQSNASNNVKRVLHYYSKNWNDSSMQNPYTILDLQEIKTTWHPVGI